MRSLTIICAITSLCACAETRRDPPQGAVRTISAPLTGSAPSAPSAHPAPPPAEIPPPSPERVPMFEAGTGILRLGVMYSRQEADVKRKLLSKIVTGSWPVIEVWGTASGNDRRVTHRLQIAGVAPGAAVALCDWLQQYKGWHPGAAECALRVGP